MNRSRDGDTASRETHPHRGGFSVTRLRFSAIIYDARRAAILEAPSVPVYFSPTFSLITMQKYFVSYTVVPSITIRRQYRQHAVFFTDDFETVLSGIIPTRRRTGRGKIEAQVREYRERGRVHFGRAEYLGVIKNIVIRKLPKRDRTVLTRYL